MTAYPEAVTQGRVVATGAAPPGRLGIGVVSAGRVGAVLAAALRGAGHAVVGGSAVSEASIERLDVLLPGVPRLEIPEVVRRAELVILAVPDDSLPDLVSGLAALDAWQAGQLVVHTSGRHGLAVLAPAAGRGAITLAIHPAMTFTGTSLDLARLPGSVMAVTAATAVLPIGQALVMEMGAEPVVIADHARPAYHAALSHAANHLVTVVAQARDVLAAAGVADPGRVLGPLTAAAVDNAVRIGDGALTGPIARGDVDTVAGHLRTLDDLDPEIADTYRALALATARRAVATGRLRPDAGGRLVALLRVPLDSDSA